MVLDLPHRPRQEGINVNPSSAFSSRLPIGHWPIPLMILGRDILEDTLEKTRLLRFGHEGGVVGVWGFGSGVEGGSWGCVRDSWAWD